MQRKGKKIAPSSEFLSGKSKDTIFLHQAHFKWMRSPPYSQCSMHFEIPLYIFAQPQKKRAVCPFCFWLSTWTGRPNFWASQWRAEESRRPRFSQQWGGHGLPLGRSRPWLKMQKAPPPPNQAVFRSSDPTVGAEMHTQVAASHFLRLRTHKGLDEGSLLFNRSCHLNRCCGRFFSKYNPLGWKGAWCFWGHLELYSPNAAPTERFFFHHHLTPWPSGLFLPAANSSNDGSVLPLTVRFTHL